MSYKPIPKKALIHTIIYTEKSDNTGGWGGSSENEPETIKHVRVEPKNSVKKTAENEEKLVKGLLFLDAKYSKPFKELVVDSEIKFGGQSLTVLSCEPAYTDSFEPHHYEVELI